MPITDDTSLADDLLRGIQEIAEFIDESEQRTSALCAQRLIPAGRLGYMWIASKRRLRQHYAEITSGAAAAQTRSQASATSESDGRAA